MGEDRLRVLVAPLPDSATASLAGGAVIVAASTAEDDRTLARLRAIVLVAGVLGAALAAGAATLLTRRALRPLTSLSAAAAEIAGTRDAARRLPETASRDEVGRLSAALNRMLAALERAQDAERRFVGDVSHELRTPLTALRGNAEHAARHGADPELLADIAADAERLALLVEDLLALARQGASGPPPDVVHLDDLAHEAAEAEPRLEVAAPAPVAVRGDRDALRRALANLVDNALRYGPPDAPVAVRVARAGAEATIAVTDAGRGPGAGERSRDLRAVRPRRRRRGPARLGPRARDREGHRGAPRRARRDRGQHVRDRAPRSHGSLRDRRYTTGRSGTERLPMRSIRTLRTRSAVALAAVPFVVVGAGVAVARATDGPGPTPPPAKLDVAVRDALTAKAPAGVTARIRFSNNLIASGALPGGAGSALLAGATGRAVGGLGRRPARAPVGRAATRRSCSHDGTLSVYDASSNTVYRFTQARRREAEPPTAHHDHAAPSLAQIDAALLAHLRPGRRHRARRPPTSPARPPTPCASRRSTTAACSAPRSSPGTRSTACRCAPRSTRRATRRRCSS